MFLERFKTDILPLRPRLLALAMKMTGNAEDAEDVAQEVLLRLWTVREQLNGMENPAGFAMQTVRHICIDRLRSHRLTVDVDDALPSADELTPYAETERRDAVRLVRTIIDRLPGLQKMIICLRDIEGYELDEIAGITGTQTSAVTANLSRARKKVREQFQQMSNYINVKR